MGKRQRQRAPASCHWDCLNTIKQIRTVKSRPNEYKDVQLLCDLASMT